MFINKLVGAVGLVAFGSSSAAATATGVSMKHVGAGMVYAGTKLIEGSDTVLKYAETQKKKAAAAWALINSAGEEKAEPETITVEASIQ